MTEVSTLLEFLESTGAKVKIFDIGRRLSNISRNDFLKIEKQHLPYPYPLQQQAWFGMSMLDPQVSHEPVIWFLHFPLDETGKLQLASRDYFMHRLFEAGVARQTDNPELSTDALKDNPHVFKPRDDKMAAFHARLAVKLKRPPSRFYAHSREYFSGQQGWDQWQFIGFQGIADMVERIADDDNHQLLLNAMPFIPASPLQAVCQCLENIPVSEKLAGVINQRLDHELNQANIDTANIVHLLRALAISPSLTHRQSAFRKVMHSPIAAHTDLLAAISARCWEWLYNDDSMPVFLNHAAHLPVNEFNALMSDLMFMPGLRELILKHIRSPQRTDALATAFQKMLRGIQS